MNGKILVTGATGNVGQPLVEALHAGGHPVVAAARDPVKARAALGLDCEYAAFDFTRPYTFRKALTGVDRVFVMRPPAVSSLTSLLDPFFAVAREAGVRHVVYLSVMGADRIPGNPHRAAEKYIRGSGIPYTLLRPGFFMQNLQMHHARRIREKGEVYVPAGRGRTSFIDTRDIGEVGARVLTEPGHVGQTYTLTGAEALDYYQVAEAFSAELGRPVRYASPGFLAFRRAAVADGYPAGFASFMTFLYLLTRFGLSGVEVHPDAERLLGRRPRSMREYVRDHVTLFG